MENEKKYAFSKKNRLSGNARTTHLFLKGRSFIVFPFRVVFFVQKEVEKPSLQMMVSVPKRRLKHAVDRNFAKRRIREAFRLQKKELETILAEKKKSLQIAFCYVANETIPYAIIEKKMAEVLKRLS